MRFAVLPDSKLQTEDDVVEPVLATLKSGKKEWSFADLESALKEYPAMAVRKAVWYLNSRGKVRFNPAMTFSLQ